MAVQKVAAIIQTTDNTTARNILRPYLYSMYTGSFIKSTPLLDETYFEQAIIYITEHNANGAAGFVVNKPYARTLNQLEEFKHYPAIPLYEGGPVDTEHLFFIHRRADIISGGTQVANNTYLGGNFKQAIAHLNNNTLTSNDIKLFIGYCGWDNNELEGEIAEGSWVVMEEGEVFEEQKLHLAAFCKIYGSWPLGQIQ